MGNTRDFFKKIRDIKGTFHAKMSTIMNRNVINLIEAKHTKNTGQPYKKDLHNPDNHGGMITHLEPDILECKSSGP